MALLFVVVVVVVVDYNLRRLRVLQVVAEAVVPSDGQEPVFMISSPPKYGVDFEFNLRFFRSLKYTII